MKGRRQKTREQRVREGNPGRRPLPAPVVLGGRPGAEFEEPPEHLPTEAKEAWRVVVPTLLERANTQARLAEVGA
jgi:phage terminase small subunit